jgi:hypothetical protein
MAGEHIAILQLLRLKNALTSTILSKEFIDLCVFDSVCQVLMNPDFWKWAFVMSHALYAPMRVLCLADQKSPAMDKLYYYVLQTDRMLAVHCKDADDRGVALLTAPTIRAMDCSTSAGLSDEDSGSEDEDNGVEDNDDDDSISAQSSATENINDNGSYDDDQQVFMWTFAFI